MHNLLNKELIIIIIIIFSWSNLVRKNYEIEKACLELEMEINQMKAYQ